MSESQKKKTEIITGPPLQSGEWTIRTQTQVISKMGKGSLKVTRRPVAVLLSNEEETRYLPVTDVYRQLRTALLAGCALLFFIVNVLKLKINFGE